MHNTFEIRILLAVLLVPSVIAKRDGELYCATCEVIIDEINYAISKVDAQKTIEIEGFRVDPHGNQKSKTIPYARSEVHLTEVTENLCSDMNKYAHTRDKSTNKLKLIRTDSRDGKAVTLENVSMNGDISERLRYVCDNIIEEHEEDIVKFFKKDRKNPVQGFCSKLTKLCSEGQKTANDEL